jgi:hypothetical protein
MSPTRIAIILTKYACASSEIEINSNVTVSMKIKCFIAPNAKYRVLVQCAHIKALAHRQVQMKHRQVVSAAFVMSFYWGFALLEAESMCRPGEWMPKTSITTASMPCRPCPVGMECIAGNAVHCPVGTMSLEEGASQCCHRNITCPHGHAVSNTDCKCVHITCPVKTLVLGRELHCINKCDSACKIVDKDCNCAAAVACDDGTWWRVGNKFSCFFTPDAKKN